MRRVNREASNLEYPRTTAADCGFHRQTTRLDAVRRRRPRHVVRQLFYVFDAAAMALWLMTEPHTRHGGLMLNNGRVVGTIAPKPKSIALIRGVQYRAEAVLLSGEEAEARARVTASVSRSPWR